MVSFILLLFIHPCTMALFLPFFIYFCFPSCMFKTMPKISLKAKEKIPPREWESYERTSAQRRKVNVDLKVSGTFALPVF